MPVGKAEDERFSEGREALEEGGHLGASFLLAYMYSIGQRAGTLKDYIRYGYFGLVTAAGLLPVVRRRRLALGRPGEVLSG